MNPIPPSPAAVVHCNALIAGAENGKNQPHSPDRSELSPDVGVWVWVWGGDSEEGDDGFNSGVVFW